MSIAAGVTGTRKDVEYRLRRPDGTWVHLRQVIEPIPGQADADGKMRWFSTLQDVTEERRAAEELRESQQLLQAIIDNSAAVIYVKDLQGRYLLINRRYSELFHISNEAIVGKSDHELFPQQAADAFRAMDQRVAAADVPLTAEEVVPHDDGPHTYVSVKCPLRDRDGRVYGVFGISTDITDRKHAQAHLQAQLARLTLLDQITARHRRAAGPAKHLPGGDPQPGGATAGGLRLRVPLRRAGKRADGHPRGREQPGAGDGAGDAGAVAHRDRSERPVALRARRA